MEETIEELMKCAKAIVSNIRFCFPLKSKVVINILVANEKYMNDKNYLILQMQTMPYIHFATEQLLFQFSFSLSMFRNQ